MRTTVAATLVLLLGHLEPPCPAVEIDAAALFQQLDANHDGRLVRGETAAEHRILFDRLLRTGDADQDGKLTADELSAALTLVRGEKVPPVKQGSRLPGADALVVLLAKMDVNGDNRLVKDEIPADCRFAFQRMLEFADGDKNGALDQRELAQESPKLSFVALRQVMQLRIDVPAELAKLPAERRQALERDPIQNLAELLGDPTKAPELFKKLDSNADGFVQKSEFPPPLAERFDRLMRRADRNGDQKLSEQEFVAAMRRMAAFRGPAMMSE